MKLICPKCKTRKSIGSASRYDVFVCRSCGWHFRGLHANHTFGSWLSDPFFAFFTACPYCWGAIQVAKASNRVGVVAPDVCHHCGRDLATSSNRERDWRELYNEKKYLELTWHPTFMGGAKKETLEGLLAWVRRNQATIDPDDFEIAVGRLERFIRKRQAEASHDERK